MIKEKPSRRLHEAPKPPLRPTQRPTIILADDHPMMLEGIRLLLEPEYEVVAAVADGMELVEVAARLRPDMALVDVSMPVLDGIEATRQLATVSPDTRVLVLSFHRQASWVQAAFEAGAWGYLAKTSAAGEIERAVRAVSTGQFYISPGVTRALVAPTAPAASTAESPSPAKPGGLTEREVEVVRLVGEGLPNKEIASALRISVTTVRTHLSNAYEKLGKETRVELALFAAREMGAGR